MRKSLFIISILIVYLFTSCDKEKKILRKQAGVWEITKWQAITYSNGVITKDTTVNDMGYIGLWDNDLNPFNAAYYSFTYVPSSISLIANNATGLDPSGDHCSWEGDHHRNDRLTLEAEDNIGVAYSLMFTITKSRKNKQEWTYISTVDTTNSTMGYKEIFTVERTK